MTTIPPGRTISVAARQPARPARPTAGAAPAGPRPAVGRAVPQTAFADALARAQALRSLPLMPGLAPAATITRGVPQSAARVPLTQPAGLPAAVEPMATAAQAPAPAPAQLPGLLNLPGGFGPIVAQAAQKYGVDPALIAAVIETESSFNPAAVSKAGARGLMQLMPTTARGLGVTDASDPLQNVLGGAKLLGQLLTKYGGDVELGLAAYNAGSGAVDKHGGIPPYAETRRYVPAVLGAYERYRQAAGSASMAGGAPAAPAAGPVVRR